MKVCDLLPGSNKLFTVEKYKHFLSKSYSKINLFVCLETHFLLLVEDKNNALENNDNKSKEKHELAITNDKTLKADQNYSKRVEENLTHILNNPITAETTMSLPHSLLKAVHKALLLKMIAMHYSHHLLDKIFLI